VRGKFRPDPLGGNAIIIVNFSHPLTSVQVIHIEQLVARKVERTLDIKPHFEHAIPFIEQAHTLVNAAGLSSVEWQTAPLLLNLPSLNIIAALVLSEVHGRMGYFPMILRLRPVADTVPPQFEVAELLNLQAVRDTARQSR
jgi:hypothetical protein